MLSTCAPLETGQQQQQQQQQQPKIAFSGATDGSVAIWDLSAQLLPSPAALQAVSSDRPPAGGSELQEVQPLWACQAMHQSGVNAMSAAFSGIAHAGADEGVILTGSIMISHGQGRTRSACITAHI